MDLWTEDLAIAEPSDDQISQTLLGLGDNEYTIIGTGEEIFMQTFRTKAGFLLEKREGSADHHYEAVPIDGRPRVAESRPWFAFWQKPKAIYWFSGDEVIRTFCNYKDGDSNPDFVTWNQIKI